MTNFGQNENVFKTIGGSKNFEDRIRTNSEIYTIHWKYIAFLTTPNRHVRGSICFMQRAERCKIEEIWLKCELLKYIGKIMHFWPTGAETIIFVTFGAQSAMARFLLL